MIPEIGQFTLIMALFLACLQAIIPLWGSFNNRNSWMKVANASAYGQLFFVGLSFLILAYSLVSNDFSVGYVAQNSNSHLPILYRFCATWGAHEGSLLLWVFILCIWTALVAGNSKNLSSVFRARILSVLAFIAIGFYLFLILTSNPFTRILPDVPINGRDLNPLLQDPGLAIHPPMLYMGYVGFSVAFAFAIAALISGKFDADWARRARPWTLIAWSFLTLGITLGSWWAYRVLGWGGWWFWDPVENASFLPWLSGTALIHSLMVADKRDSFKAWTVLLAVATFSLSLMGTFLVRSGILVSVHAFAIDPLRGAFMLYFLAIVVGGSLGLYAWRGHTLNNSGIFNWWSRETLLLSNNVILTSSMLTVLLGTVYPLIIDGLGLGKLSVGPPYFNTVFIPLMIPLLVLMGIGPAVTWQRGQFGLIIRRLCFSLPLCILLAIFFPLIINGHFSISVFIGLLLAFWTIVATLQNAVSIKKPIIIPRQRLGMLLAHLGFGICVIGVVATSAYSIQRDVRMQPGDSLKIGPYSVNFQQVTKYPGPNFTAYQGHFLVQYHQAFSLLYPELRLYTTQKMALAKTAIRARPFHDLYVAMGEELDHGAWSLRIYYKPFVRWIWAGGLLMMAGGVLAAVRFRKLDRSHA